MRKAFLVCLGLMAATAASAYIPPPNVGPVHTGPNVPRPQNLPHANLQMVTIPNPGVVIRQGKAGTAYAGKVIIFLNISTPQTWALNASTGLKTRVPDSDDAADTVSVAGAQAKLKAPARALNVPLNNGVGDLNVSGSNGAYRLLVSVPKPGASGGAQAQNGTGLPMTTADFGLTRSGGNYSATE